MASKRIDLNRIKSIINDKMTEVMISSTLEKYRDLVKEEFVKGDMHPSAWKESAAESIQVGEAWFNFDDMSVYGNVVMGHDEENYQDVRLNVLADGNQHHGPLYTEPGKTSWNKELTEKHTQDHTLKGRPVVWVHNTNYPNAKKKIYRFSKRENRMKEYTATVSKFYPLFGKTYLPDEFNKEGYRSEVQNAAENAAKRMEATNRSDLSQYSEAGELIGEEIIEILQGMEK